MSLHVQNQAQLSHGFQRLGIIGAVQAPAGIERTLRQLVRASVQPQVVIGARHFVQHLRLHVRILSETRSDVVRRPVEYLASRDAVAARFAGIRHLEHVAHEGCDPGRAIPLLVGAVSFLLRVIALAGGFA